MTMGKLYVVATPIGNVEDMSTRAQNILSQVAWVAAEDTRHSQGLLNYLGIDTPLVSYHDHNEQDRSDDLIQKLKQGQSGALISDAGTPLISDPGYRLVLKAHEQGITVIPIPGACALIAALSASGLATDKFLFAGFLPHKTKARCDQLATYVDDPYTLIFYEAPHRILETVQDCVQVLGGERLACIAREITKKFESIIMSPLTDILQKLEAETIPAKGEFVLMVAGKPHSKEATDEAQQEIDRILNVLLAEMPLKQAVQITVKLTGGAKNFIYDRAMALKQN
jgi:16S rRNA (cytidine1402-2'-O)-methyltransferase